ncbi:uncharacterized protein LOC108673170 [Hyalella azteca]|uniref:Uncharacterized protein LOC108673170 n=1 Tax=Hyalella azteca TaxID=294128 RepID=A0A8B7NRT0_HYAAZ|nr:uncharacterized protein LOC108673170 [Hyalella azteca]
MAQEAEAGTEKMAQGEHEGDATADETQKAPWEQPLAQFTEKPIMSKGNRRAFQSKDLDSTQLFFRFLVHASQDHETIFHILISAFNTAAEEIKKDPEFLRLDSERYDCFKKLNTYMQILYKGTQKSAKLRFLLQVILSQLGLELLLKCARDTEDIIQDFIPCIQQYLDEEGHVDVMTQQEKGEQLLQEYEEKTKEWEKEEQRIRRRKKREMQRQMKEEEGDANLIPLPGQEAPVMPDFSSKNDASDVDDSTNENDHDTDNEKTTDETEEQLTKVGEVSGDEQIDDIDDNSKCEERENEAGSEETEKRCGSDEEEDGVLLPCGGESKWLGVLVDVLLALCTRGESWWRVSLKPTAFLLAGRMTSELLSCVTEVLFNEDLVQSNKKTGQDDDDEVQDQEKAQEEEDKESDNESDDIASGDNEKVSTSSSKKKQDDEESDEDYDSSGGDESEDSGLDDEEDDDVDDGADSATVLANKHKNRGKINLKKSQDDPDVNDIYSDDSDDEEEEDGEDDDDSQDEEDDDDEEEEVELETSMKQSKLDEMKSALFRVLGPTGPDDAVEEDMDKVPPEELRALNIQLGAVLGSYIKKKTNNNPNALSGVTADIVQFRNRALDIVEGLIDGPLPCELLLRELMLPLLQTMALHAEERMTDLNNRIRKAIQHIREKKKYINVGDMSFETFQECLAEFFDVAKVVPEAKHGFVTLIRCSAHFCREKGIVDNPIIPAYIGHAKNFIRNPNVEGTMVLEPLFLEIPELRTGLCRGLVEEIFSPVVEEEEDEEDFKVKCRRIFEKKKEYPNNYPVLDGKMTSVWLFLEALYSRILPNVDELTEDERWTVEEVVKHIVKFTETCTQPKLKDVAIINFVLKIILRYPCGKACVDWEALCKTLFQYRVRMSRTQQGGKGVKMELKKLLDTSLRSQCPYALSILKDRKDRKRQRQVTRKEKKEAKKQELSDVTTPAGARARKMAEAYTNASKSLHDGVTESIDDLFKPNAKRIDEDDPDMDVDERLPQKRKREEEAEADILRKAKEIRASKTALNRKKRQSRKLSKKCKKAALAKLKEMEKELKLKRVKVDVTENNVTPKTVERIPRPVKERKPKETDDSLQIKDDKINRRKKRLKDLQQQQAKKEAEVKEKKVPEKLIIKANRKKADAAMNKELQPGLFKYCNKDMCDD